MFLFCFCSFLKVYDVGQRKRKTESDDDNDDDFKAKKARVSGSFI